MSDVWYDPITGAALTPGGELVGPSGRPRVYVGGEAAPNTLLTPVAPESPAQEPNRLLDEEAVANARAAGVWDQDPRSFRQRLMGEMAPRAPEQKPRESDPSTNVIETIIDNLLGLGGATGRPEEGQHNNGA